MPQGKTISITIPEQLHDWILKQTKKLQISRSRYISNHLLQIQKNEQD
jgi:hypothetical protein